MIEDERLKPYSPDFLAAVDRIAVYEEQMRYIVDEGLLFGRPLQVSSGNVVRIVNANDGLYISKELKPTSREALVFGQGFTPEQVLDHERHLNRLNIDSAAMDLNRVATNIRLHQAFMRSKLGDRTVLPSATYVVDDIVFRVQPYFPLHSPMYP